MNSVSCPFLDLHCRIAKILQWVMLFSAPVGLTRQVTHPIAPNILMIIMGLMLFDTWLFYVYYYKLKYSYKSIGLETIQRLGAQLTPDQRDQLWSKDYMTLHQWDVVRQQIERKD